MSITFTIGEFITFIGVLVSGMVATITVIVTFLNSRIDKLGRELNELRADTSDKRHDMYGTIHKFQEHCTEDVERLRESFSTELAEIRRQLTTKGPAR